MLFMGQPILVYDVSSAIREGLVFKVKQISLYKTGEDTLFFLELKSGIHYKILLEYLDSGWKIVK
jgi:hypothetical protein